MSAEESLFGITPTRMIAKTMVIAVRDKMPISASFFPVEILTFQRPMTGIESTITVSIPTLRE